MQHRVFGFGILLLGISGSFAATFMGEVLPPRLLPVPVALFLIFGMVLILWDQWAKILDWIRDLWPVSRRKLREVEQRADQQAALREAEQLSAAKLGVLEQRSRFGMPWKASYGQRGRSGTP